MVIQTKLTLVRTEMEREMLKAKEDYKLQLNNELTIKMTNVMRSEIDVTRALWEKELEITVTDFAMWT